jgi:hypothetical protein
MRGLKPQDAAWKKRMNALNKELNETQMKVLPPPFTKPTQGVRDLAAIGSSVHDIFNSEGFKSIIKDFAGVDSFDVKPIFGTWEGQAEPSFVIQGEGLTFDQAQKISQIGGLFLAQDAAITYRPSVDLESGTETAYIIHSEKLTDQQIKAAFDKAIEVGLDVSLTTDGLGVKALNFGTEGFWSKAGKIQEAASIDTTYGTHSDSYFHETQTDHTTRTGQRTLPSWVQEASGGQSLLQRGIDSILAPYARAAAAQGYIFDPVLYGERFGLDSSQVEYLRSAVFPRNVNAHSSSPLLDGREELPVKSTYTLAGKRETSVKDMLHALQMRSAEDGFVMPGDYSERAAEFIAETIADEVESHIQRSSVNPNSPNAVGWYDATLKKMKRMYSRLFPFLEEGTEQYNAGKAFVFDAVLGITSQGNDVYENGKMATRILLMLENGASMPEIVNTLEGTFGGQTVAIENNLLKLHSLLQKIPAQELRDMLFQTDTVSSWNKRLKADSRLFYDEEPLSVEGGSKQLVTGFMAFGPKIGSFINNLHGDYSTLTADLWYTRTWNRIIGRTFKYAAELEGKQVDTFKDYIQEEWARNEAKRKKKPYQERVTYTKSGKEKPFEYGNDAPKLNRKELAGFLENGSELLALAKKLEAEFRLGGYKEKSDLRRAAKNWIQNRELPVAAPRASLERKFQQDVMNLAQEKLKQMGIDITIADMQAVEWFNEKELFQKYGAASSGAEPADYADAAEFILNIIEAGALFQVTRNNKVVRLADAGQEAELTGITSPNKSLLKEIEAKEKAMAEAKKQREKEEEEEGDED